MVIGFIGAERLDARLFLFHSYEFSHQYARARGMLRNATIMT